MRSLKDYTGQRYNRLVALWFVSRSQKGRSIWMFACDCGIMFSAGVKDVVRGHTKSCGCLAREKIVQRNTKHGLAHSHKATYRTWKDMRARCNNPNNEDFANYGGRGIAVCAEWDDFATFVSDMGARPDGLTIDRVDTNGNYEKSNCRWADAETQANNKRNNRIVGPNGETLAQMAKAMGMSHSKLAYRLDHCDDPYSKDDLRK